MIIRTATRADDAACAAIFTAAWNYAFTHARRQIDAQTFRAETSDEVVFVAEAEGCVVGFASLYAPDAFLHHLYVDPARQGGGIGARLLAHVIAVSQAPLTLKCQRSNAQALRLYARHGFTEIGGGDDPLLGPWALLRAP